MPHEYDSTIRARLHHLNEQVLGLASIPAYDLIFHVADLIAYARRTRDMIADLTARKMLDSGDLNPVDIERLGLP